jgi:hypothetical protein
MSDGFKPKRMTEREIGDLTFNMRYDPSRPKEQRDNAYRSVDSLIDAGIIEVIHETTPAERFWFPTRRKDLINGD